MTVSASFRESAYARETDDVWLVLVTIEHDDLTGPVRVVNNREDIESNGHTFTACPFDIQLPSESEDAPPRARVVIDNVSQEVTAALRQIDTPASATFQVILASAPDTIEAEWGGMTLRDIQIDAGKIAGTVGLDDLRLEPFPVHSFGPTYFSGLF